MERQMPGPVPQPAPVGDPNESDLKDDPEGVDDGADSE